MNFTEKQIEAIDKVVLLKIAELNDEKKQGVTTYHELEDLDDQLSFALSNIQEGKVVDITIDVYTDKVEYEAFNEEGMEVDSLVAQQIETRLTEVVNQMFP